MPNSFNPYTAQQVGEVAVALAKTEFKLASVVARYGPNDFLPGRGRNVYLSVPGALTAHSRQLDDTSSQIVYQSLIEHQEAVSLSNHAYSAVTLSEEDLALNLQDFGRQVLRPQVDAVVDKIETAIERVIDGITPTDPGVTYSAVDPVKIFTAGRSALRARGVETASADLVAIVGASVVEDLLDSGALDYEKTGSADALRSGSLGRVRGFETIESNRIAPTEIVFMPRTGIYLAHRPPATPDGAAFAATVSESSISMRYVRHYDMDHTAERSTVGTFVGAGLMPLYRVTRIQDTGTQGDVGFTAGTATVTEVPGGSVVKLDVAP